MNMQNKISVYIVEDYLLTRITYKKAFQNYSDTEIVVTIKQNENKISFEAKNESPYINPETMESLFKKYVSHAAKYNKVGVGLGLYLSKQIVDAHNGEIYAQSFKENYNIFGFVLPLTNTAENVSDKFMQKVMC